MHNTCWWCHAPCALPTEWLRRPAHYRFASSLKAYQKDEATQPTRVLTSKHQQEGLSRKHVKAKFTDVQNPLPLDAAEHKKQRNNRSQQDAFQPSQPQGQEQEQSDPWQQRHAAFSDFTIVEPYSRLMALWCFLLIFLRNWLGCWAGVFAAMLWFAADGSRYSSRMQQPSSGSTALSLLITSASTAFCYLMRASPGGRLMLASSLAIAAGLVYILLSGGNPIASRQPIVPSVPSDSQPPPGASSTDETARKQSKSKSRWQPERSRGQGTAFPFFGGRGKQREAQPDKSPADATEEALLQASSAAVAESVGSNLSPAEAESMERAIAAGLRKQLPKAIEGVFMDPDMNMRFDVTANVNTLFALVGVIFFWRGIWTLWDVGLGDSMGSEIGGVVLGLVIMAIIRWRKLPLAEGLPGV